MTKCEITAKEKMNNKPTYKDLEKMIVELKNKHKAELYTIEKKHKEIIRDYENTINKNKEITNVSEKAAKAGSWSLNTQTNEFVCSDNMSLIHGLKPEEFDNSLEMLRKYIHPDDLEEVAKKTEQSILEKKSFVFEYRVVTPDGDVRYIYGTNILIFNTDGELIEIIGMNMDVTELKKAENEIRKLSVAVEQSPSTIVITNLQGNIEYVNSKFTDLTGYAFEEVKGKNANILNSGKTNRNIYTKMWKTLKKGITWKGEFINKKKNDIEFIEYATIAPIFDKNGKTTNYIAIKEDVTVKKQIENTLKQNEKKLRELNSTKDKFFSIIAHDLRSPFNALIGFSNILLEKHAECGKKKREQLIQLILSSSEKTYDLLENLLQWGRAQTDGLSYNPNNHDLQEIFKETLDDTESIAKRKNMDIVSVVSENSLIYGDKDMIKTVLRNIITNAIKFTKEGGLITIGSKFSETEVLISVKDTGVGMSKEKLEKLFDIAQKTNTLGTNNEAGTGLGLVICKEFVKKHGGEIWIESSLGKGSDFKFTLPLKKN